MTRIAIISYPNVQQASVLGLRDLIQATDEFIETDGAPAGRFEVKVVERFGLCEPTGFDVVILPPCLGTVPKGPVLAELARWISEQHTAGSMICSICVGAFILAETGLLDGRPATTHWELAAQFRVQYPKVQLHEDKLIIDDGDLITAGGMMAWTDLALLLIARYLGPAIMQKTAKLFLIDPGRREQSFYNLFTPDLSHGDANILTAQRWLQANFKSQVGVPQMASVAGLEERTFLRRFRAATGHNPSEYLQRLRIGRAREQLEMSTRAIGGIANEVGYLDVPSFGKLFKKSVGLSPGQYRKRFSP